jgi:hypothetical protein
MSISLEDGILHDETVHVPKAASVYFALVHSLRKDKSRDVADDRPKISVEACNALRRLAAHDEGCAAMLQLELLVAALQYNTLRTALVMVAFCSRADGREALVRAGVCEALVRLLISWKNSASRQERGDLLFLQISQIKCAVIDVVYSLCKHESRSRLLDVRARLIKCGITSALIDVYTVAKDTEDNNLLPRVAHCLHIVKRRFICPPQQQYPRGFLL